MENNEIITSLAKTIGYLSGIQQLFPNTEDMVKEGIEGCTAAINTLSEKEAYKPQPGPELTYVTDCCCGRCDASIFREDLYCRLCGYPVDWSKE